MLGAILLLGASGCAERIAIDKFPPGVLRVRYMPANDWTDCMVACTVMCANYVTRTDRFASSKLRDELEAEGLDVGRVGDVTQWLAKKRITLQALTGEYSSEDLVGLGWWVLEGGYPVICVINKLGGNADNNHAVVVIGVEGQGGIESAKKVYVLDPASPKRLETWEPILFRHYWGSAGNIMLPMYKTPDEAALHEGTE